MNLRSMFKTILLPALLLGGAVPATGCAAFKLEPPTGFAEVEHSDYGSHMKANNNVGLRVHVFDNVRGGDLLFWSQDLVEKLGLRRYELRGQTATKSANGVAGTRFDFAYTPIGDNEAPRFYSAVLFVSDRHRVVLSIAGLETYRAQYEQQLDGIIAELKVRGCKVGSKVCKSEQPPQLATTPPTPPAIPAAGEAPGGDPPKASTPASSEGPGVGPEPTDA